MKTPFTFGKLVLETDFTNRIVETKRMVSNFNSSVNTILITEKIGEIISGSKSSKNCKLAVIQEAFEDLIMQLSMLFQMLTDDLNMKQISFLNVLANKEKQVTSQVVLKKYKLGTSANVIKIRRALHDREIIDIVGRKIEFMDPLYKYWLKNYYFNPE